MHHILIVHHDADLYGADKSLLRTLRTLTLNQLIPVVVVPHEGPLVELMRAEGVEVHIGPVGKLTRQLLSPLGFSALMRDMVSAVRFISNILAGRRASLAYSNSGAVLGGAIWGMLHRVPRLWHVREIVVAPKVAASGFPWLFKLLGGWCVCNSHATRQWIVGECPSLAERSSVIWNGLEELSTPDPAAVAAFREKLGVSSGDVLVTLVGRINRWKGQGVLVAAAARLKAQGLRGVRYLIVGDVADGQHHFREAMLGQIREAGLDHDVLWHPFTPEIDVVWAASDVAVVPSTWPEPFGRVAIEAMAHGLPVIAAAHGGLAEIVEQQKTGLLVDPGSAEQLADAIATLVRAPDIRKSYGAAGRTRQRAQFSQADHDRKLLTLINRLCGLDGIAAPVKNTVRILGTHGVPAAYGGFETAAENIALFLVKRGWHVIVYCQVKGNGPIHQDVWNGIERVLVPIDIDGWKGTSLFDLVSIRHACRFRDLCLTFGYNTAVLNILQRLHGIPNVINMDGIEWSRARWGFTKQAILYANERIGCVVGNHLIADHPEIEKHLRTRAPKNKISTLTYGADPVEDAPTEPVLRLGFEPGEYMTLIARPIPENSIQEMVKGYSTTRRGKRLVVLGKFTPESDSYHREVMDAASEEVVFPGAIYEKTVVQALRFHSFAYVHGHTLGGTNPSLVEAMAASNPIVAHDNPYNRWVAQDAALYFDGAERFSAAVRELLSSSSLRRAMKEASRRRFHEEFTWEHVAGQYEQLLLRYVRPAL